MNPTVKKYVTLVLLAAGAGTIYTLPYIRETFYVPMQTAMNLTNAQMGSLTSAYAIIATFAYIIGGVFADKFKPRLLLTFSLCATGLLGIWLSTFPGYEITCFIFAAMGFTTIMTFWPALIKAVQMLGSEKEQGKLFGLNEGLRGFLNAGLVFVMGFVYARYSDNVDGASKAILFCAIVNIILGVLDFIVLEKGKKEEASRTERESFGKVAVGMVKCLKIPRVWLLIAIIFTAYTVYGIMSYVPAYLQSFCGLSVTDANTIGGFRYVCQGIGGIVGGIVADKVGSRIKVVGVAAAIFGLSYGLFLVLPAGGSLMLLVVNFFFGMILVYAVKSIYFADIDEAGFPNSETGRVSGLMSAIGFLPDVFMLTLIGTWIDAAGDSVWGYQRMFGLAFAMGVLCLVICLVLRRVIKKKPHVSVED